MISVDYYLAHPDTYEKDRIWVLMLNEYLKKHADALLTAESLNERSFEIWHREKFLDREQGKKILKRCGLNVEALNVYRTTEPLSYYTHTRNTPQNILILENKDPFFSMRNYLLNGHTEIFGAEIGTLIYGAGKGIIRSFQDFDKIQRLADAGCDIIRCAVPDMAAAEGLKTICKESPVPVIADIHFDYKLALAAIEAGVDGLRLNPGNIGGEEKVRAVVEAAKERNIPIRIGVNAGSLPKDLLEKYGHPTAEALVEAAWRHVRILEAMDYRNIKISLKAHDVPLTLEAYRLMAAQCDYPLHVGITEAGTVNSGIIKSAVGIGTLLAEGIGDTIRVSLTGDPVNEVRVAYDILKSLGLREHGPTLISCPTCGRTRISLVKAGAGG